MRSQLILVLADKDIRAIFDGDRLKCLVGALDRHGEGAHVDVANPAVGLITKADNELGEVELVWKVGVDGGFLWSGTWNLPTVYVVYVGTGGDRGIGSALLKFKVLESSYGRLNWTERSDWAAHHLVDVLSGLKHGDLDFEWGFQFGLFECLVLLIREVALALLEKLLVKNTRLGLHMLLRVRMAKMHTRSSLAIFDLLLPNSVLLGLVCGAHNTGSL